MKFVNSLRTTAVVAIGLFGGCSSALADANSERLRLEVYEADVRAAEVAYVTYLKDVVGSVQEGHRAGFAQFEDWYHKYQDAQEKSDTNLMEECAKYAFEQALSAVLPAPGNLVELFKWASKTALDQSIKALKPNEKKDIPAFLAELKAAEYKFILDYQKVPQEFSKRNPQLVDAVMGEYVLNKGQHTAELPESAKKILKDFGVPVPGGEFSNHVMEEVFISHILSVYRSDPKKTDAIWAQSKLPVKWADPVRAMAVIVALRHIDAAKYKERICYAERTHFYNRNWTIPYGQCPGEGQNYGK